MMVEHLTDADFGYPAWRGFIVWASGHPDFQKMYAQHTGIAWPSPAKNGLEAMIDDATGHLSGHLEGFMLWATEHYWGVDEAPPKVRAEIESRKKRDAP